MVRFVDKILSTIPCFKYEIVCNLVSDRATLVFSEQNESEKVWMFSTKAGEGGLPETIWSNIMIYSDTES